MQSYRGADLLPRLRHALRVCPASGPEVLKGVGVGVQVNPGKTDTVASSLSAFLDASKAYVDIFRTAGILGADLDEARALMTGLLTADDAQQTALDTKKELNAQKDAACSESSSPSPPSPPLAP